MALQVVWSRVWQLAQAVSRLWHGEAQVTLDEYKNSRDGGARYSQRPVLHEQLTVGAVAVTLTPPAPHITRVLARVERSDVRWRDDGVAPTGGVGMPLLAQEAIIFDSAFDQIQFIKDAGAVADATLNLAWYNY